MMRLPGFAGFVFSVAIKIDALVKSIGMAKLKVPPIP